MKPRLDEADPEVAWIKWAAWRGLVRLTDGSVVELCGYPNMLNNTGTGVAWVTHAAGEQPVGLNVSKIKEPFTRAHPRWPEKVNGHNPTKQKRKRATNG